MPRLLLILFCLLSTAARAMVPDINARLQGSRVVAKDRTGKVVWDVPVPRLNGKVGTRVSWINSWIPEAVIVLSRDELDYHWFTLLDRRTGQVRWQGQGNPLAYAAGLLLVEPDVPSGYPNRWKFQRFDVRSGKAELVVFRYDRPRRGCGTMTYSRFGPTSYVFPSITNPRRLAVMAADECGDLELTYDWTAQAEQAPRVRALPCLDDAFQSIPCAREPK